MLSLPPAISALIETGRFSVRYMLRMDLASGSTGVWSGDFDATVAGVTYGALSGAMSIATVPGTVGLNSDMLDVTATGLAPSVTSLIYGAEWHQRPAVLFAAFLDDAGAVQHVHTLFSGFMDTLETSSQADGTVAVTLRLESTSRELGRSVGRVRSHADQQAVDNTDTAYRYVGAVAANPKIYWGRKGPQSPWG